MRIGRLEPSDPVHVVAKVYPRDVVYQIKPQGLARQIKTPTFRGKVRGFSSASAKRLRFLIRNTAELWTGMLTLTYPDWFPEDGPACKRHVNAFCQWLRRRKIAYVWVLEFQERGAPHFHFLLSGFVPKDAVARAWWEIVGTNQAEHLKAGTRIEAVKDAEQVGGYMAAYTSKLEQKTVPEGFANVGRFWGASRVLKCVMVRMKGLYRDAGAALRSARKLAKAKRRGWRRVRTRFRWKGWGFTLIDGADWFKMLLRQAVQMDSGVYAVEGRVWKAWDGTADPRPPYMTPEQRINTLGQLDFDGRNDIAALFDPLPQRRGSRRPKDVELTVWGGA